MPHNRHTSDVPEVANIDRGPKLMPPEHVEAHFEPLVAVEGGEDTTTTEETDLPRMHGTEEPNPLTTENITEEQRKWRRQRISKVMVAFCMICFLIFLIVDSFTVGRVRSALERFLEWIEVNPVTGFFVFMLVYLLSVVLVIPGSILTLGAGFVFAKAFGLGLGVVLGTLSVFLGASLGAMISFLLGRYLLREWVQKLSKRYVLFEVLDVAIQENGFRIMALLRLLPVVPFVALNYIGGVTAISFRDNALALTCILPGTVAFVFVGATGASLNESLNNGGFSTMAIVLLAVGAVFGIVALCTIAFYARKELNRLMTARRAEQEETYPTYSAAVELGGDIGASRDALATRRRTSSQV